MGSASFHKRFRLSVPMVMMSKRMEAMIWASLWAADGQGQLQKSCGNGTRWTRGRQGKKGIYGHSATVLFTPGVVRRLAGIRLLVAQPWQVGWTGRGRADQDRAVVLRRGEGQAAGVE